MDKPGFDESAAVAITGKIMVIAIIVLFLVVVFVLFLHLYAKWFWWRIEEPTAHPSRRNRRRFVFAPGQDNAHPLRAGTKGLDSKILASLPVLMFRQEEFKEGLECAVCLCELVEGEKARLLPKCTHGFHVDCIDMWFQSHSTCPLCRNPVSVELENSSPVLSGDEINGAHVQSPNESLGSGYNSADSPCFPTNVLFWGDQTQVSSGGAACLEEGAPGSSSGSGSVASSSLTSGSARQDGIFVIDVPMNVDENFPEEESKSPMPTRLRSLKRLLSREKRAAPSSSSSGSSSVDV